MTPKTTPAAIALLLALSFAGQLQAASGKLFIFNNSARTALTHSENPTAALAATDRVELTAANSIVTVKRCGFLGCLDPVGRTVSMETIRHVNAELRAEDLERSDKEPCRVCIPAKTIPTHLEDYVERIKSLSPELAQ